MREMRVVSLGIMSVMFWTGVAVAQTPVTKVPASGGTTAATEQAETRLLNAAVYQNDLEIEAANTQALANYKSKLETLSAADATAQAEYEAAVAAHQATVRANEAQAAENARAYEEAMRQWRADVAACEAGVRARCAPRPQ
jgi:hypothetical protein